jgi:AcrR family transcriptional regulator
MPSSAALRSAKPAESAPPFGRYVDQLQRQLEAQRFPSKGERTRFRLKLAAIQALAKFGFTDLKVSDICAAADVALGTFYVYYADKAAIACAVLLEFGEALHAHAKRVARGSSDYEAILLTNQHFVAAYQLNAPLVRCLVQLEDQVPSFRDAWRQQRLHWIETIAASIARRSGHPDTPKELSVQVAYALEGMVFQYLYEVFVRQDPLLSRFAGTPEQIADLLSVLWYRAIYREDPPRTQVLYAKQLLALHRDRT